MPYMIGTNAIRRTIRYLQRGRLTLRNSVRIVLIYYNENCKHSQGTKLASMKPPVNLNSCCRDFVHWNVPQLMYKNPNVQILFYKNMFPTPFIQCWLDTGEEVLMDNFGKSNREITNHLVKTLGQPKYEENPAKVASEVPKLDICNFGSGCARHCLCEIPGQFPCPAAIQMPKEMTGKYRFENMLYPPKGLYKDYTPVKDKA